MLYAVISTRIVSSLRRYRAARSQRILRWWGIITYLGLSSEHGSNVPVRCRRGGICSRCVNIYLCDINQWAWVASRHHGTWQSMPTLCITSSRAGEEQATTLTTAPAKSPCWGRVQTVAEGPQHHGKCGLNLGPLVARSLAPAAPPARVNCPLLRSLTLLLSNQHPPLLPPGQTCNWCLTMLYITQRWVGLTRFFCFYKWKVL